LLQVFVSRISFPGKQKRKYNLMFADTDIFHLSYSLTDFPLSTSNIFLNILSYVR
jgi:hypothetical protein